MPGLWNQIRKNTTRRTSANSRQPNRARQIERLETRITPVVGALSPPAQVPDGAFPGVVFISQPLAACTGSLLSSGRHILTAAHCVDAEDTNADGRPDGNRMVDAGPFSVRFDMPGRTQISINVPAANVQMFDNDWRDEGDIAIITLPDIAPLGATRYDIWRTQDANRDGVADELGTAGTVGRQFTMVGYGQTGSGTTGDMIGDGLKRQGANRFEALGPDHGLTADMLLLDFDNGLAANDALGNQVGLLNETMVGRGDSGGPGLIGNVIAGVASRVWSGGGTIDLDEVNSPNSSFGDIGGYVRVSTYSNWIDNFLNASFDLVIDMTNQPAGRDGGKADTIELRASGADMTVLINGKVLQTVPTSRINAIRVLGSNDSDTLIVDANVNSRVSFDGRGGTDHLTYKGDNTTGATYAPGGSLAASLGGLLHRPFHLNAIDFTGFEAASTVTIQNMPGATLVSPNAKDAYTVTSASKGMKIAGKSGGATIVPLITDAAPAVVIDSATRDWGDDKANDSIAVKSTSAGTSLDVLTGAGDDTIAIGSNSLDVVYGSITVDGGGGLDTLNLNDTATANKPTLGNRVSYDLTDGRVVRTNQRTHPTVNLPTLSQTINHRNILRLNVAGSHTGNAFRMDTSAPGPGVALTTGNQADAIDILRSFNPLTVNAGRGADSIDVHRSDAAIIIDGGADGDTIHVARAGQLLTDIIGPITVKGGDGGDSLLVYDTACGGASSYRINGLQPSGGWGDEDDGGPRTGSHTQISDPTGGWRGAVAFDGTAETTHFEAGAGDNFVDVQWTLAATTLRLSMSGGNDTIRLHPDIAGIVTADGGAGSDTLDFSSYLAAVKVDLSKGIVPGLTGYPTGFENATGGSGDDLLIGTNGPNRLRGGPGRDSIFGGMGNDVLDGGQDNDTLVGDTVAYGLDKVLDLRLSGSQSFNWGGLKEKWLIDAAGAGYYITPAGELFKWDQASGPGTAVALRGLLVGSLHAVFYDEPSYLANAQPGTIEVDPTAVATAQSLDSLYGFGPVQTTTPDGRKWFPGSGGTSFYIVPDGTVYRAAGFEPEVGRVDPVYYARPELLTAAADGGAAADAAFDLDRSAGLWSDGAFAQNSAGRNEKWVRDAAGAWYTIETSGAVLKNGAGAFVATLDSSYWSDPSRLYNAYTSRLLAAVTSAVGYPDHDTLLGMADEDVLVGGAGRNLLIGGRGADALHGESDEDILIGGYTEFDDQAISFQALDGIMSSWTDSSRTFDQRVGDLAYLIDTFWTDGAVHKDDEVDRLTGYAGRDWFFAATNDVLVDLVPGDRLDWTVN